MKCKLYIITLFAFASSLFFAGCESDYTESLVSPSIEIVRVPSMDQAELTVNFKLSRTVARYEYAIGEDTDKDAFLNGTYSSIVRVDNGEDAEIEFTGLTSNKVYTIFARAYNAAGKAGPLASIKEKTRGETASVNAVMQFVSVNSAAFTITSDISYYKYEYALGIDADRTDFETGTLTSMKTKEEFSTYTPTFFDLEPGTDYIFYVRGYDRISNLPTETTEIPIRTALRGTVPEVECTVNDMNLYAGKYLITPNQYVSKAAIALTLNEELDPVINNENWRGDILRMLGIWTNANSGDVIIGYNEPFTAEFKTPEMLLGEYDPYGYPIEAFIIVYDLEDKPFSVQKFKFKTPEYDNNAKTATATLKISNITKNGAFYEFFPNEHCIGMFFETFDADWVQETMQSDYYYDGFLEQYLYQNGFWSYLDNVKTSTYPERFADPGKTYYVYYMAINANGLDGFGPLNYQVYKTLPEEDED